MTANLLALTREKKESPMKRLLRPATALVAVFVLVLFAPAIAFCQLSEGFENGVPEGWTFSGPASLDGTDQASSGITPTEGTSYGWISTGCMDPIPVGQGTTCPTVATVPSPGYVALGLGDGTGLGTPTVQTTLATSPAFTLTSPGGVVSFDVNFITTDGTVNFADFALVQLVPSNSDSSPINLFVANTTCDTCAAVPPAILNPGVGTLNPTTALFSGTTVTFGATTYGNVEKFGGGPGGPTGWIHVTYSAAAGTYTLRFLVSHVGDKNYPTALAMDNVQAITGFVGDKKTVGPGTTIVDLTPPGAPPVTEHATFPANTSFGNVTAIQLIETPVSPDTFNANRFPANCDPHTTSGGVCNGTANTFSGGAQVPISTKCIPINGPCVSLLIRCFGTDGLERPNHCLDIVPPPGKLINLNSLFTTPTGIQNPAVLIASDGQNDWANITTSFDPGDTCTKPPCNGGGGSKGLNSESVLADLNLGSSCQALTYTFTPSHHKGETINVTGTLGLKGCPAVDGQKTLFGKLLVANATFALTGPFNPPGCIVQTVTSPSFPLFVPLNATLSFQFPVKIPKNACDTTTGTGPFEFTSTLISGPVSYINSATFAVK